MIYKSIIRKIMLLAGVIVLGIGGCVMINRMDESRKSTMVVIKSPADNRDYRFIELDNGLKALLISDPQTDKAAAAVDVAVGSYYNPESRPGLAHFLEHMLFLGNKKYPEVNSYFKFIDAHGGSANAYTTDVRTNYYFDINSDQLQPALDQLSQFFVAPSLDPAYVDRERHAVDSEFRLHTKEDIWRTMEVLSVTSNPDHPKSRFSIGNLDTLSNDDKDSLWQDLKAFYNKYYVASNMGVVVYGRESLNTLEKWVETSFSDVPDKQQPDMKIGTAPYDANALGVRINIIPLKEARELFITFPMPTTQPYFAKKPLGYLSRILGYEGKGSLHSLLKEKGLIDSLSAYTDDTPGEFSEFSLFMELTPKGLEQVDAVTAIVFDYIELIRRKGLQSRLYDETRQIADIDFRFKEKAKPQQTVSGLVRRLHYFPAENILNMDYLYEDYDPDLINRFLSKMTPENMRQVVIAKGQKTDKVEPYFNTHYSVKALSPELVKRLYEPRQHKDLAIPASNEFIAHDMTLRKGKASDAPQKILEQPGMTVWSMTDTSFDVPKADIHIKVSTLMASQTPEQWIQLKLYQKLLSRSLNEFGYPAREAGLQYAVSSSREGLSITLTGYQDKQKLLLERILQTIDHFQPEAMAFEQEKEQLIRKLKNKAFLPPYRLGVDALKQVLYPNYPDDENMLQAAGRVTIASVKAYSRAFFQKTYVNMLVHGNFNENEARQLAKQVKKYLVSTTPFEQPFREPHRLMQDQQRILQLEIKHNDSMLVAYYQRTETSNTERAKYALLAGLLGPSFYNSLRTEQQLGYVVTASAYPFEKHPGMIFIVQSPKLDPVGLENRMTDFLETQQSIVASLTDKQLETYRKGLINDLLKKDANLNERGYRFWSAIESDEAFDNRKQIADEVAKMTVTDMRQALDTLVKGKGRLIIRSWGDAFLDDMKRQASDRGVCHRAKCLDELLVEE
ncbi:Protease 3 [invertebrate metagenome]|uniref:Protease 3 n=1 Tax=invertebrate metagenome TaxID=1711999 RepID=A0A2H9TA69_9ZZZZ